MNDNINLLTTKTVSWVDQGFSFVNKYSDLFVWGFVAIMASKLFKVHIGSNGGKRH